MQAFTGNGLDGPSWASALPLTHFSPQIGCPPRKAEQRVRVALPGVSVWVEISVCKSDTLASQKGRCNSAFLATEKMFVESLTQPGVSMKVSYYKRNDF